MTLGALIMNYGVFEVAKRLDLKWAFIAMSALIGCCAISILIMLKDMKRERPIDDVPTIEEPQLVYEESGECEPCDLPANENKESNELLDDAEPKSDSRTNSRLGKFKTSLRIVIRELSSRMYIWVCLIGMIVYQFCTVANSTFFSAWVEDFYGNS